MPRIARSKIITQYCHVIVQGIERKFIFKEKYFKELYLSLLKDNLKNTKIEILGYCVMDNHVHTLIYVDDAKELSKYMQKVNTCFAVRYNKIHDRVGYVFRSRYYLQPIKSERQLFNCLVYIHRNPIKANIVANYEEYKFSSYKEFITKRKFLLSSKSIELLFGSSDNYMETFKKIHSNWAINDIEDIKEYIDEEIILKDFLNKYKKSIEEVKEDKELLKELIKDLTSKSRTILKENGIISWSQ